MNAQVNESQKGIIYVKGNAFKLIQLIISDGETPDLFNRRNEEYHRWQ